MSVSAVGSDLDAILGSNEDFQKRLANMRDAQTTLEQAQTNLNLGKDAKAALEEAQRVKVAAERDRTEEYNKLQAEMQLVRDDMARQVAQARTDYQDKTEAANTALLAATSKEAQANDTLIAAKRVQMLAETNAQTLLADATSEAGRILTAAKAQAKAIIDEGDKQVARAKASNEEATAIRQELEGRLAKLKAAME